MWWRERVCNGILLSGAYFAGAGEWDAALGMLLVTIAVHVAWETLS